MAATLKRGRNADRKRRQGTGNRRPRKLPEQDGRQSRRRRHQHHEKITGVEKLRPAEHDVIPDRIEAGTLLIAGAITGGEVTVNKCQPDDLTALTAKMAESGSQNLHRPRLTDGAKMQSLEGRRHRNQPAPRVPDRSPSSVHVTDDGSPRYKRNFGNGLRNRFWRTSKNSPASTPTSRQRLEWQSCAELQANLLAPFVMATTCARAHAWYSRVWSLREKQS